MDALDVRRRSYTRHRDARVALIRCSECGEYYESSVRQARRIQKGESRRLCYTCRCLEEWEALNTPDQTESYVNWWLEESGLSRAELRDIASMMFAEEARSSEPVPFPSRRLPSEEGNHTNGHRAAARVFLCSIGLAVYHSPATSGAGQRSQA